ncbi:hypothetical protein O181_003586 [Austropuccinia psidii MF-1]|uniref:Uncharacterized protein n=1 Tax=Austropuccinia psidii MF-1 TaxID=1389203 RepID=A0A9Q3GEA1_9BASI|nr:hypothetical protein [Austropuccinia psidii MF-1]
MQQTTIFSTQLAQLSNFSPESGSEISDMDSSNELGIEVESLEPENNLDPPVLPEFEHKLIFNPPSSQNPNLKRYDKEKSVEPWALTEDVRQDEVVFSGKLKN